MGSSLSGVNQSHNKRVKSRNKLIKISESEQDLQKDREKLLDNIRNEGRKYISENGGALSFVIRQFQIDQIVYDHLPKFIDSLENNKVAKVVGPADVSRVPKRGGVPMFEN